MSGVEVAGLVVGVLPILIETIKSYSTIAQGFRTFRHYSEEVKNFAVQVKVQKGIFWNEVRLLLRSIGYVKETEEMLEDSHDIRWTSQRLHSKLDNLLRHDLELYCDIIEETWKVLEKLKVELARYSVLLEGKSQTDSIRTTIKRLRGAIKITFDKSQHESCLARLRDQNADLKSLRSQHDAFRQKDVLSQQRMSVKDHCT